MFTKYNNVTVPKNYSGNRFKEYAEDITMKTHRAQEVSQPTGVKTSVSPFFRNTLERAIESAEPPVQSLTQDESAPVQSFVQAEDPQKNDEIIEITDTPADKSEEKQAIAPSRLGGFDSLTRLFEGVSNDDLLLLALILLLAGEDTKGSIDTIALLALLLMYHQD